MSLILGNQLVFVFAELAFNDLLYKIDGYIHVIACLLRADNVPFYGDCHLDFLASLSLRSRLR